MKTMEEFIAYLGTPEAKERHANRLSDPAYHRLKALIENPLRDVQVVYLLEFDNGLVKVGQTRDYDTRRSAHRSFARRLGCSLIFEWRMPTDRALEHEQMLIRILRDAGGTALRGSREWFEVDPEALTDAIERFTASRSAKAVAA